jgi:RHS repeat-associated protein
MEKHVAEIGVPHRLLHLPLVMDVLRRTGVLTIIDTVIHDDRRCKVSTSDCVSVMLFRYNGGDSFQEMPSGTTGTAVEFVRGPGMGGGIGSILYSDRTMVSGGTLDPNGNVLSVRDANSVGTDVTFDARNRPLTSTDTASEKTTMSYDDNLTDGSGVDGTYPKAVSGLSFGPGTVGSAVAVTNPAGETSIEVHDGIGRTIRRMDGNGNSVTVGFDVVLANGLVSISQADALGHTTANHSDAGNHIRESVDADGNLSFAGFDPVGNQLSSIDPNGVGWSIADDTTAKPGYDGRGHMLMRTDTHGDAIAQAYDAYGRQGIMNTNGTVSYSPSDYGNFVGFTGRYHDWETGLVFFRYRYYDTSMGRFIGRDPLEYIDGLGLYGAYYVPNNHDAYGLSLADCLSKAASQYRTSVRLSSMEYQQDLMQDRIDILNEQFVKMIDLFNTTVVITAGGIGAGAAADALVDARAGYVAAEMAALARLANQGSISVMRIQQMSRGMQSTTGMINMISYFTKLTPNAIVGSLATNEVGSAILEGNTNDEMRTFIENAALLGGGIGEYGDAAMAIGNKLLDVISERIDAEISMHSLSNDNFDSTHLTKYKSRLLVAKKKFNDAMSNCQPGCKEP